jgi:hypothetical protein
MPNSSTVLTISLLIIACAAVLTGWLVVYDRLTEQTEGVVIGTWMSALTTTVGFWLGSSAGRGRERGQEGHHGNSS